MLHPYGYALRHMAGEIYRVTPGSIGAASSAAMIGFIASMLLRVDET